MKLQMPSGSNFKISLGKDPELSLRGVPDHPEPLWQHHNDLMEKKIQGVLKARQTHLEIFAAAFLKEVGSSEATKYQPVEEWSQGKIRWRFEKAL